MSGFFDGVFVLVLAGQEELSARVSGVGDSLVIDSFNRENSNARTIANLSALAYPANALESLYYGKLHK